MIKIPIFIFVYVFLFVGSVVNLPITMAINPVRIDYLTVCGFIHSQNKFCVCNLVKLSVAENLFSAGLMNEDTLKITNLQH
jgi:hypothetical protein